MLNLALIAVVGSLSLGQQPEADVDISELDPARTVQAGDAQTPSAEISDEAVDSGKESTESGDTDEGTERKTEQSKDVAGKSTGASKKRVAAFWFITPSRED